MTTVRNTLIAGWIGAVAATAGAHAADMPGDWTIPAVKPIPPRFTELMSGWYLRGDVAYRWNHIGSVHSVNPITHEKFGNSFAAGGGFGYKYQWIRTDLTFDFGAAAKFRGATAVSTTQPQYTAKIETLSGLANVYFDLGTWGGITPYVGAGAGATHLRATSYIDTTLSISPTISPGSASKLNFSWAYMAGVAVQVAPSWLIDVGYRHIDLGDIPVNSSIGPVAATTTFKSLSAQEVRVGFRYLFD